MVVGLGFFFREYIGREMRNILVLPFEVFSILLVVKLVACQVTRSGKCEFNGFYNKGAWHTNIGNWL